MRFSMGTCLLAFLILFPVSARAITLGQIQTFENGRGEGWLGSAFNSLLEDGGPAGVGDAYVRTTRPDTVPGSLRFSLRVAGVWGGDYLDAGVNAIEADFINFGTSDLSIRFVFGNTTAAAGSVSSVPFVLPPDGRWHHVRFGLSPADMTPDPSLVLRNVSSLGFMHLTDLADVSAGGTPAVGSLGIDNIRATPEPVSLVFLVVGVGGVFAQGRPMRRMG